MGPPTGLTVKGSCTLEEVEEVEVDWSFEFAVGAGRGYTVVARRETRQRSAVGVVEETELERQPMAKKDRVEVEEQGDLD